MDIKIINKKKYALLKSGKEYFLIPYETAKIGKKRHEKNYEKFRSHGKTYYQPRSR